MANDFLFELGCEELPSGHVLPLGQAMATQIQAALDKAQLTYGNIKFFATPRRLAVLIETLKEEQPSQMQIRRGPALQAAYDAAGQPTPALLGFAKSCQVSLDELTVQKTDKGEWLVFQNQVEGGKTIDILPQLINQVVINLPIAKPMRWGAGELEFVRPVHWLVMMYGNQVIPATILGVNTGSLSYGHRFHHPEAICITCPKDYEELLRHAYVIADFSLRRTQIIKQVHALAASLDAEAIMPDALVDEVTSIVEWPQALLAQFEKNFLEVPPEALIAAMQNHQKCFALQTQSAKLMPFFITVANILSHNPPQVIAGNEKVMRARLSDAAFFFNQDKKQPLSSHIIGAEQVVFEKQLGSLQDKARRMQVLMRFLAGPLSLEPEQASRAAELSKCDLLTGMVGEFPELQGLMGFYYAQHDGEDKSVAIALNEQYMPRFAGDELPTTQLGLALSLADRLDTLMGIFAIGQKPTGVKDPYKLRRHALAVVRLLLNMTTPLNLSTLLSEAHHAYGDQLPKAANQVEVQDFILERMQSHYLAQGFSVDLIQAVRAKQQDWLYDFDQRIRALANFIQLPEAAALSAACKRVNNILQQVQQANNQMVAIQEELLTEGTEKALFLHLTTMEQRTDSLYIAEDYSKILNHLASLREPVDAFFDSVMVMVDDLAVRNNRLNLLTRLRSVLQGVADISLLQLNL